MPFYTFTQNNSGGYFIVNECVNQYVIIEAKNVSDAVEKAERIFENYSEYCTCCGERWNTDFMDERDGTAEPMICDTPAFDYQSIWGMPCVIVYTLKREKLKALYRIDKE